MSQKSDQSATLGLGNAGIEYTAGAGAGGPWIAVQCVGSTAFSTFTSLNQVGTLTGVTFSDGFTIRAPITAFTVSSGAVVATRGYIN